jgi:hypothetical protein
MSADLNGSILLRAPGLVEAIEANTKALQALLAAMNRPAAVPVAQPAPTPAPTPAPAAPAQPALAPPPWSDERRAFVRENWALPIAELTRRCNLLPGPALNSNQIGAYGRNVLNLPPRTVAMQAAPADAAPPRPSPVTSEIVRTDIPTIRHWAAQRGITFDRAGDLPTVNAKRRALGLAVFEIEAIARRA